MEPDDSNPRTPLTPETIDRTPMDERVNRNQLTPTITEETEQDDQTASHKSSLSLPVEPPLGPEMKDRRKLSVQGLMAFAERRRSSASTFADMRKMSVSNGDSIHIRSPGGTGNNPEFLPHSMHPFKICDRNSNNSLEFYTIKKCAATPGGPLFRNRPSSKMTKYVECWGADKPFANITDSKMAKNIGLAVCWLQQKFSILMLWCFVQINFIPLT